MYERTSEPSDWGVEENFFMAENTDDDEVGNSFFVISFVSLLMIVLHQVCCQFSKLFIFSKALFLTTRSLDFYDFNFNFLSRKLVEIVATR